MEAFVAAAGVEYETVFYVGDGHNDLCPILRLGKVDVGCVRRGYRLEKEIQRVIDGGGADGQQLYADVIFWNDGKDLLEAILMRVREDQQ